MWGAYCIEPNKEERERDNTYYGEEGLEKELLGRITIKKKKLLKEEFMNERCNKERVYE